MEKVEDQTETYTRAELLQVREMIASTIFRHCRHVHEKGIAALDHPGDDALFQEMVDSSCICDDSESVGNCAHRVKKRRPNPFRIEAQWLHARGLLPPEEVAVCVKDTEAIYDTDVEVTGVYSRQQLISLPVVSDIAAMERVACDQDAMIDKLKQRQREYLAVIDEALARMPE